MTRKGPREFFRSGILGAALLLALIFGGQAATAAPQGTITWASHLTVVPAWLNPSEHNGIQAPLMAYYAIHDALVKAMPEGTFTPSLAQSWTVSPDGLVYEFKLRPNVTFHNGDPVTSEDAKFSFERYNGAGAAILKSHVALVETPNPQTVRYVMKAAWPDFMTYFATAQTGAAWVLPKRYLERVGDAEFKNNPVGAGPYRFKSITSGIELVLEANENYWRKQPNVRTIIIKSIPDELTRAAMLKRGEADIAASVRGAQAENLRATPGIKLVAPRVFFTQWLVFTRQWDAASPWSKREVREAVNLAINRKEIADAFFVGFAEPAGSIVPPGLPYAKKFPAAQQDIQKAKALMAQAGYPNGFDGGDFHVESAYAQIAEAVQNYLQEIGIKLRLRPLERGAFVAGLSNKSLQGVIYAMLSSFDNAGTWLDPWVLPNGRNTYGEYPEVSELIVKQSSEVDEAKRAAMLADLQTRIYERRMFVPLVYAYAPQAVGPRLEVSGLDLIPGYAYVAPYEDVKLK